MPFTWWIAYSAPVKYWHYHRKNGWLQLLSSNNKAILQYIHAWNQGVIVSSNYISLLQFLFYENAVNLLDKRIVILQLLFHNRTRTITRMDGFNRKYETTQYLWKKRWLQVLVLKKHSTLGNNRSLHVASWDNNSTTQINGCKCSFEITIHRK